MTRPLDLHREIEAAAEMAANAVMVYLRQCGLRDQESQDRWLDRVFDLVLVKLKRSQST